MPFKCELNRCSGPLSLGNLGNKTPIRHTDLSSTDKPSSCVFKVGFAGHTSFAANFWIGPECQKFWPAMHTMRFYVENTYPRMRINMMLWSLGIDYLYIFIIGEMCVSWYCPTKQGRKIKASRLDVYRLGIKVEASDLTKSIFQRANFELQLLITPAALRTICTWSGIIVNWRFVQVLAY